MSDPTIQAISPNSPSGAAATPRSAHAPSGLIALLRKGPVLFVLFIAGISLFSYTGCAMNPEHDPSLEHHTENGYRNVPATAPHEGFWKWKWDQMMEGLPKPPANGYAFPVLEVDTDFLAENTEQVTLTWIGHATLLLQIGGVNILVDPMFSERASPVSFIGPRRKVPPAMTLGDLPKIHIVLISHNHYDHMDLDSVRRLAMQAGGPPHFFVPLGYREWFGDNVFNGSDAPESDLVRVIELDWWESRDVLGMRVNLVQAQHFSARTPFDTNEVLWGGFVVEHPSYRFYWAGDTGYGPHFREIGRRFGPIDLAALPIGAYEPRWFMGPMHINPEEAVQAHLDVKARHSVGVHWGTFEMTDETLDEPPKALTRALEKHGIEPTTFFVMQHGETRILQGRTGEDASRFVVRRNGMEGLPEGVIPKEGRP